MSVLLVKIEGPVGYTIYHHLPLVEGVSSTPSFFINQPMGIWDIYGYEFESLHGMFSMAG